MKSLYLEGGKICTSHGVKGLVKVEHLCDSPKVLTKIKRIYFKERNGSFTEKAVLSCSVAGQFLLMGIEGINSREEAIAYRGRMFYLNREDVPLPKGAMFIADMIGLPVFHAESGESLGEISDVSDVAGRRIYTVKYQGREVLIPDVPEFIKEISEERGMAIMPIPGLFDDADEV
ncbi:MAG: 16S rRNA processing protein RimM [Clostridia bacterium]|nr:16S rRNA processing protein RimM [Clostridia bacterium]